MQYLVSFLVLQSSRWGRERDGGLKIAFNVMGLLVLCVSSSRRNGLVWSAVCDCGITWPYSTDFFHAILNS